MADLHNAYDLQFEETTCWGGLCEMFRDIINYICCCSSNRVVIGGVDKQKTFAELNEEMNQQALKNANPATKRMLQRGQDVNSAFSEEHIKRGLPVAIPEEK